MAAGRPAKQQGASVNPMKRDPALIPAVVTIWLALGVFVLYPFVRLLGATFYSERGFSLLALARVFTNWYDRLAFINSLRLGLAVAALGTVLGFLFAYAVTRLSLPKPLKWLISAITVLPLVSPPFTSSIALTLSLGPRGFLLNLLGVPDFNIYGFLGTLIAETLTFFPVAFLTLSAILVAIDPNIEDAALSLGSSRLRVFRTVTLPLAIPGLANAFLLLFASSLADFATPLVLAGHNFPVLPTQAYLQITGLYDLKGGAALSFVLLVPALIVYAAQRYWVGRRSFVTVSGKVGARTSTKGLGRGAEAVIISVITLVSLFILMLYLVIVLGSLIRVWGVDNSLTLDNYAYVFTNGLKAIKDTLIIALVAMPLGGILAVAVGYITAKKNFPGNKAMEFISLLNYALPGTVVGIGYVLAFNSGPIVLTGTMTILVAVYAFRYDATGIRSTIASLQQIDNSLEEASLSLGASSFTTFRKVTLPLIIPAFVSGLRFLFTRSMTAISATIFLVSVRWTLLTTRILECITELQFAQAAAFSVVLIGLVFALSGLLVLLFRLVYPSNDLSH